MATGSFIKAVTNAIAAHHLLAASDKILVGVSGGPDSMALLHALHTLCQASAWPLAVGHLNHKLRPEANDEEAFVGRAATRLGLPFFSATADVAGHCRRRRCSLEEAGRTLRHRFLARTAMANGFSVIALGHHADDNAEWMLMSLLRGSGRQGLSGIPMTRRVRDDGFPGKTVRLIRPLLGLQRREIAAYLSKEKIPSVTDASNQDLRHRRNRIRHELLPLLRCHYNPNIVEVLNRVATLNRDEESWAAPMAQELFTKALESESAACARLSRAVVVDSPPALQRRIIRLALARVKGNLHGISLKHVDMARDLLRRETGSARIDLPGCIRVRVENAQVVFSRETCPLRRTPPLNPQPAFSHCLPAPGTIDVPELGMAVTATVLPAALLPDVRNAGHQVAFFDMDAISFPLVIRSIRPGDRFNPFGQPGSQKVKKFFIDHKVPPARRSCTPVMACRDHIIWLMGYRTDDHVKITDSTRNILKVRFTLA